MSAVSSVRQHWSVDSFDWEAVRRDLLLDAADPDLMFYLVAASSFLESTTELYTANLVAQFHGDHEVTGWLEHHWLPEELQHGRALRRYVRTVWPDFDWDRVYQSFLAEFAAHCCADELEPTRSREMASRCVVEMATASYYTTLSRLSREPVLASIARCIADDEVRHYKHFHRYLCRYQQAETTTRTEILAALINRLRMIEGQDSLIAVKHLHHARRPGERFNKQIYRDFRRGSRQLIQPHFPHRMCVKMLLQPLGLGVWWRRMAVPVVEVVARQIVP